MNDADLHINTSKERLMYRLMLLSGIKTFQLQRGHKLDMNWVAAATLYGLGSTSAMALCRELGLDPRGTRKDRLR